MKSHHKDNCTRFIHTKPSPEMFGNTETKNADNKTMNIETFPGIWEDAPLSLISDIMIQPNELRMNNYVSVNATYRNVGDLLVLDEKAFGALIVNKAYNRIFPIPLTLEWLLILGFKEMEATEYTYDAYSKGGIQFWHMDKKVLKIEKPGIGYEIEYVHQVQNLHFIWTKEELIIDSEV